MREAYKAVRSAYAGFKLSGNPEISSVHRVRGGYLAEWLAAQLSRLQPGTPLAPDQPLRSRVYAFQLAQGLSPDGLAGPITFMQLNRAIGIDEPRLHSEN